MRETVGGDYVALHSGVVPHMIDRKVRRASCMLHDSRSVHARSPDSIQCGRTSRRITHVKNNAMYPAQGMCLQMGKTNLMAHP